MSAEGLILIAGAIILATSLVRRLFAGWRLPALVGYIVVGLALGAADQRLALLTPRLVDGIDVLAQLGVTILLFKVGLESNIVGLLAQLRGALLVWAGNVLGALALGFAAAHWVLGLDLLPSLFTAAALSATSVGVSTAVWRDSGRLDSDAGSLVVDVAELDDISAILMMVLLFSAAPVLAGDGDAALAPALAATLATMLGKLALLVAGCYLFARFAERRFTGWFIAGRVPAVAAVATAGIACVIAGTAAALGFTVAVGALLAGLAFSRDPAEFEIDQQLDPVYELLSPFFFVAIGFSVQFDVLGAGLGMAAVLLAAAVLGKLAGAGVPAAVVLDRRAGLAVGVSMVPRAEIAMIIMLQGSRMGAEYVPDALLAAMSLVALATAAGVPVILGRLLATDAELAD